MIVSDISPRQAIEHLEQMWGVAPNDLAGAISTTPKTIERWRSGATYPQHDARHRLAVLMTLDERLADTFASGDAVRTWLHSDNRYLGGLTPVEVMRTGRLDRIGAAIDALESGVFL